MPEKIWKRTAQEDERVKKQVKSLLIVGAGSFATEVEEMARMLGYTDIVFIDDCISPPRCEPVVGSIANIQNFRKDYREAIVAFGNNEFRKRCTEELIRCGYSVPTLVHPTAYVSPEAQLALGCIIRAKAVISRNVKMGFSCIANVGALVDHDCVIGDYSHILMGAVVRNKVSVPSLSWINSNQVIE